MIEWKKGENKQLSKNFTSSEFSCQCKHKSCKDQKVSEHLIENLQKVRDEFGHSIRVTSGYRCAAHQADLRAQGLETATGVSSHEKGEAADIRPADSFYLINDLLTVCKKHFMAIGVARTFIHVDERRDKERRWGYAKV